MNDLKRIQPPVFPVGKIDLPEVSNIKLTNGINVYLIESGTEEVTRTEFIFRAGQIKENIPLLASTTNMMLREDSQNYSSEELNRRLDFYGAFLNPWTDKDMGGVTVFSLNKYQGKIIELCNEMIFRPAFPREELEALMNKRKQWFHINREKVQNLAYDKIFELMFGPDHPYGYQIVEDDFDKIDTSFLREFHTTYYDPGEMAVIVSGRIPLETVDLLQANFGGYKRLNSSVKKSVPALKRSSTKKSHIKKENVVQTAIRIGSPTINKRHPDYFGLKVLDTILGGYFGSRLMKNIREEKGYTYGIRSNITSLDLSGYKTISTEVGNEYVTRTIDEIYKEINILQDEIIAPSELKIVKNYMLGEMVRMFDGPFAAAESFRSAWEFGLNNDYYRKFADKIRSIGPDEIKALAQSYYNTDELFEVIAGK
ncbi:MAG TPA: pitrilysin family protein [Bacteroidales bacterium]|nr:pitrilysin family protein [Bacteroidales bacterium]